MLNSRLLPTVGLGASDKWIMIRMVTIIQLLQPNQRSSTVGGPTIGLGAVVYGDHPCFLDTLCVFPKIIIIQLFEVRH